MNDWTPAQQAQVQARLEEAARRLEQSDRRREEDGRQAIAAARQMAERSRQRREAEAQQRRHYQARQREAAAQADLTKEKERQRNLWIAAGNPAEKFEEYRPTLEKQILLERRQAKLSRFDSVI
jgi:hypothetical protein